MVCRREEKNEGEMALGILSGVIVTLLAFTTLVAAGIDPITIKGSHFFHQANGSEFFLRGVTYQPPTNASTPPIDPLAASLNCMRDIPYLTALTTNVIRVSYIDPTQDHTACMTAFASAGIYILVDLPGKITINASNPEWNLDIYSAWTKRIDALAGFNNVLGFFAGNQIVTNSSNSPAAAFIKASIRDLKTYISAKGYRAIPIGYEMSASGGYDIIAPYMTCSNSSESIDFLGISDYNWCSTQTYTSSGYQTIVEEYASYPVPVFFAEYGCKDGTGIPRIFNEVAFIYGTKMTNVISGGIVFEYFQDEQDKGLIQTSGPNITALPDYTSYSSQIARITPLSTANSNYTVTNTLTPSCPSAAFSASPTLPPIVNQEICTCMILSLHCVAAPSLSTDLNTTSKLLTSLCGSDSSACPALEGNGATGMYGAYSMCNLTSRLSWALDFSYRSAPQLCTSENGAVAQYAMQDGWCGAIIAQAGFNGTGTVTSTPLRVVASATGGVSGEPSGGFVGGGLGRNAIVGIVAGSIVGFAALSGIGVWLLLRHRRKHRRLPPKSEGDTSRDLGSRSLSLHTTTSPDPDRRLDRGLRGGGGGGGDRRPSASVSLLSDDTGAETMSELPPFDGSYMGQSASWSRSEIFQSTVGRATPVESERGGMEMVSPLEPHFDGGSSMRGSEGGSSSPIQYFEGGGGVAMRNLQPSPLGVRDRDRDVPPSPMGSEKELPAFRRGVEDKSLASMKLLSPVVKVSPV